MDIPFTNEGMSMDAQKYCLNPYNNHTHLGMSILHRGYQHRAGRLTS